MKCCRVLNLCGTVLERYEYDAYGNPTIWNADFTTERDSSNYGNPYLFTGRRTDYLDSGSLKIQYNHNRYYDYYTGRWLTHDPLGIVPNSQALNYFKPDNQYLEGLSLYEYASSTPVLATDPWGLKKFKELFDFDYKKGTIPPEDGEWEYGEYDIEDAPKWMWPYLIWVEERAMKTQAGLAIFGFAAYGPWGLDASKHLAYFLSKRGGELGINYCRVLKESRDARIAFWNDLITAMRGVEKINLDENATPIVQEGYNKTHQIMDNTNWYLAMSQYHTYGKGVARKGKGRRNCCYYMNITFYLRDNYEFGPIGGIEGFGGYVWDTELHKLNKYGWAQHFKLRGSHTLEITWIKGYELDKEGSAMSVIMGNETPVP